MSMLRWAALAAIAATAAADNCCHEARGTHEVMEDNTTECCRLVAPMGATAQTLQLNCTMLPVYTCFTNPKGKITTVKRVGSDPGACCAACIKQAGCVSWTHTGESSCNLYSDVGPTKAEDKSGCSAGMIGGHGRPMPPVPPPPPPQPRNGRPNLLFLVVRSRTCAQQPPLQLSRDPAAFRSSRPTAGHGPRGTRTTWSSSRTCASCRTAGSTLSTVSAAAVRPTCLPPTPSACTTWFPWILRAQRKECADFSNSPVCCPSRSAFWSGLHVSNMPHKHPGYPNITVGGAWNNYEGLPVRPSQTRLSRLADDDLRRSYPSCTGLFALRMTAALNRKWWSVCRTGSRTGWTRR